MEQVTIRLEGDRTNYTIGDLIVGAVDIASPHLDLSPANVEISLHCIGEVKWIEYPRTPAWMDGCIYNEEVKYHEEVHPVVESEVKGVENLDNLTKFIVPFKFALPKE